MANDANLTARGGSLVEAHTSFQPRVFFFYFIFAALLLLLAAGLAYQQLFKNVLYQEAERVQNQRRILVPGPRGVIRDREGRKLADNQARFTVVLFLDELRGEFRREWYRIHTNFLEASDKGDMPTSAQMATIARNTVVQRYLNQVNAITGRHAKVDGGRLAEHFSSDMLLPYTLVDDLTPDEFARLVERLPVRSPLQVYASTTRFYPYDSAAAHTLGFVSINPEIDAEDFPGGKLRTFKMKGTIGKDGLERRFDSMLQGDVGGKIYRVDPAGYRINPPLQEVAPKPGEDLVTSLDIDLQLAAEKCMKDIQNPGAAVALDVNTGEVLVLASEPDYDLNQTVPRIPQTVWDDIIARDALRNRAVSGVYHPGSTFKLITAIAGLRSGVLTPESTYTTNNVYLVGNHPFRDHRGCISGEIDFRTAIEQSVNTYFINFGLKIGVDALAAEAHRFHLDERTGIELPGETRAMLIGTPEWKRQNRNEAWYPGDTANMAFGQGFVDVTPLEMACFVASLARGETCTKPTLIHQANRAPQHSAPIGLSQENYDALIEGMERAVTQGTGRLGAVAGLTIAGKTGTAQVVVTKNGRQGKLELAWFVGFAPVERPEIAFAVLIEGDTPDESYGGGLYAAPVAKAILKKWLEKKQQAAAVTKVAVR